MCNCDYPIKTRIGDKVLSKHVKSNGLVTVERYLDCIVHGPQVEHVETKPEFHEGRLVRHSFVQPYRRRAS